MKQNYKHKIANETDRSTVLIVIRNFLSFIFLTISGFMILFQKFPFIDLQLISWPTSGYFRLFGLALVFFGLFFMRIIPSFNKLMRWIMLIFGIGFVLSIYLIFSEKNASYFGLMVLNGVFGLVALYFSVRSSIIM